MKFKTLLIAAISFFSIQNIRAGTIKEIGIGTLPTVADPAELALLTGQPDGYTVVQLSDHTIYIWNSSVVSWAPVSGGGGGPPTGAAGGSLSGSYPNPSLASGINANLIANGTVSNADFQFINSLSSNAQTQINGKEPTITATTSADYYRGDKTFQTLNTLAVPELTNLYYTQSRFDTAFGLKSTTNLSEGTNLYYTQARFDTAFTAKTTDALSEGAINLYFTHARALAATLTAYVSGAGTVTAADSILSAIEKLDGNIQGLVTGVSSVSNSDGTLTISPTTGAVVASRAAITGDISVPSTSNTAILPNIVAGATNTKITYNAKGQVTAGTVLASGDIPNNAANTSGSAGSVSGTNVITDANIVQSPAHTYLGNNTGSTANVANITNTQVTADLNSFVGDNFGGSLQGMVPAASSGQGQSNYYLGANGSFNIVDQSHDILPSFTLQNQTSQPAVQSKLNGVAVMGNYAYVAGAAVATLSIFDISDQKKPILKSTLTAGTAGSFGVVPFLSGGHTYVAVPENGAVGKILFVNADNPSAPTITTTFTFSTSPASLGSLYNCVVPGNGYVYIASQSAGLVVLDIGGGGGSIAAPAEVFRESAVLNGVKSVGVGYSNGTVFTTQYITSVFGTRQFKSWNISTPSTPTLTQSLQVTSVGEPLNFTISGNTAVVTVSAAGVNAYDFIDITSVSAMTNLSAVTASGIFASPMIGQISGNYAYLPSGSNATDGGYIDLYDITNRSSPIKISTAKTGVANSVFGAIALANGYIYAADYGVSPGSNGNLDIFTTAIETPTVGNILASTETLKSLTPSTALASDASDNIVSSSTTSTELGYVHGVTSAIQTQINTLSAGSVSSVSVVSANGLAGTSSGGTTPALTLSTTVNGIAKGNGTALSAATSGTDYSAGTSGLATGILKSTTGTGALTIATAGDIPSLSTLYCSLSGCTMSGNIAMGGFNITSPTLITPNIGTPSAGVITNLTGTAAGASIGGNAGTATALQTARAINGVNFDGTAPITVTAASGTLTGTTLNATVVNSSLTSVGTLTSITTSGNSTITTDGHIISTGTAPTATPNANAGTSATCTVTGTDIAGTISLTTGSASWTTGAQCAVTFNIAYASSPRCSLTPTNSNGSAAMQNMYVTKSTTALTVNFVNPDNQSDAYTWDYSCVQAN